MSSQFTEDERMSGGASRDDLLDQPIGEGGTPGQSEDERATEQLRAHGVRLGMGGVATFVFWPALAIVVTVTLLAMIFPSGTGDVLTGVQTFIVTHFSWLYILLVGAFVIVALIVGFSPLGRVFIGRPGDEAEFSLISWFAMLFAAGMGIGLVFYGVAEPLTFATVDPKPGTASDERSMIHTAMAQTFVHWGVHPWAIYAVIGLSLALAIHRRNRPVSIRWALEPLLGDRVKGVIGDAIDVLAVIGTVFGVATSLGLGVEQITSGLAYLGVVDDPGTPLMIGLIVVITALATISVVSGVGKGIKILSDVNIGLAGFLLLCVIVFGPTLFIVRLAVEGLGVYLGNWFGLTFDTSMFATGAAMEWQGSWSIFYWGWWMSWAPFVGVFIARISRGRTVREFIIGSLLVPMAVAVVWFSALGGTAIHREFFGEKGLVSEGKVDAPAALFETLSELPLGSLFAVIAIILVAVFFITSSDSGSLVVDMLASGGHPNPPTWSRVLWAVMEGAVAIALLLAGGLGALQAGAIATALPFSLVLAAMAVAVIKVLRGIVQENEREAERERGRQVREEVTEHLTEDFDDTLGPKVDDRIDYRLQRSDPTWRRRLQQGPRQD
ncbi:choline/glycine/proline betaine transport protein [Propioniferax innocua]|uniref:Choline/glycine/proline betaine transport protein n=2 Tax=Propioniferax innocua TaxID=1753 RepID=A0A542ZRR4_9ACTN|nr:choline/glycine/proline betaine transport protein [Propioniferax innocua]